MNVEVSFEKREFFGNNLHAHVFTGLDLSYDCLLTCKITVVTQVELFGNNLYAHVASLASRVTTVSLHAKL